MPAVPAAAAQLRPARRWAIIGVCIGLVLTSGVGPLDLRAADGAAAHKKPGKKITIVIPRNAMRVGFGKSIYRLARGGKVRIVNHDSMRHSVTSVGTNTRHVPLFDVTVGPGKAVTLAPASALRAGRYAFYCKFHPSMRARLTVVGKGGSTSASGPTFALPLSFPTQDTAATSTIPLRRAAQRMMPSGPATTIDGYNGTYPGPTIRRRTGSATKVTFADRLPSAAGRFSVHLHGDHHASSSDGQPMSYLIGPGVSRTYDYPLRDDGLPVPPSFGFYHDHAMGVTGRNNWNGMQGMFIVDDGREASLGLPTGYWDRPLLIADRSFDAANRLVPVHGGNNGRPVTGATAPPGDATVGNRVLVNGRYQPHFGVYTHQYRLRLLNGSNYQSYDFALSDGRAFTQVGTGSSLLPRPVVRRDILLGPAQRADVVVNFAGEYGKNVVLYSVARRDHSARGIGTPVVPIMQFRVSGKASDTVRVHPTLEATPPITVPAAVSATWNFGMAGNTRTGTYWTINGRVYDPKRVDLSVPLGSTQRWRLVNSSPITHYVHLHEEQWHTVLRDGKAPPAYEQGLQDTWRLDPGESVDVAAKFTDFTGTFMIHCHMLNHEDDGMMAQFAVVDPTASPGTFVRPVTSVAAGLPAATGGDSTGHAGDMADMAMPASSAAHPASAGAEPAGASSASAMGSSQPAGSGLWNAALAFAALCGSALLLWVGGREISRRRRRPCRAAPS